MTPRVLIVEREPESGFVRTDRLCLAAEFEIEVVRYPGRITPSFVVACLRAIRRADVVYCFFASEHALIPALMARVLRRRFLLIPAGYDYANVASRGYGLAARGHGWLPRLIGRCATTALPISRQTQWEFLSLVPEAAPRTRLGYLAVDPTEWADPEIERREDLFVTVGYVDEEAWSRKGIDRFVELARNDPRSRYVLAGRLTPEIAERVAELRSDNLQVVGALSNDELRRLYWSASVYVQLSWHETFGMAMAEAMLCGCVPVIAGSPALREVAGHWAVDAYPGESDFELARRGLEQAQSISTDQIRSEVAARFSMAQRTQLLAAAVRGETTRSRKR